MASLVMVMPYRAYVEKARAEGYAVHAVWDPQVAHDIYGMAADGYLATLATLVDSLTLTHFGDIAAFEATVSDVVRRVGPEAVHHLGAEESMLATYRMADRLGLAVNPPSSIEALNDKAAMRALLASAGLSPVRHAVATGIADLAEVVPHFALPVVVKPTDLSGSRGVYLVREIAELPGYLHLLERYGYQGPLLVEEFLDGPEFSVETLSVDGRHHVVGVTQKLLGPPPLFVEVGHVHPAPAGPRSRRVGRLATRLLTLAGYRSGPAHTEVRIGADGPRIVESQARLGGDRIPRLVELATGVDVERAIFSGLRGLAPPPVERRQVAAVTYFSLPPGRVVEMDGLERVAALDYVDELTVPFAVGDRVPVTVDWRTRHGHAIVVAPDHAELSARLRHVAALVSRCVRVTQDVPAVVGAR